MVENQLPSHFCSFVFWRIHDQKLFRSFNNHESSVHHFNTSEELETSEVDWYIWYLKSCIVPEIMADLGLGGRVALTHPPCHLKNTMRLTELHLDQRRKQHWISIWNFTCKMQPCMSVCHPCYLGGRGRKTTNSRPTLAAPWYLVSNRQMIPYVLLKKWGFPKTKWSILKEIFTDNAENMIKNVSLIVLKR